MALKDQVPKIYSVGKKNVGSYQVSGTPYVTSSTIAENEEKKIEFPYVTNNLSVKMDSDTNVSKRYLNFNSNSGAFNGVAIQNALNNTFSPDFGITLAAWMKAPSATDGSSGTPLKLIQTYPGSEQRFIMLYYRPSNRRLRIDPYYYDNNTNSTSGVSTNVNNLSVIDHDAVFHLAVTAPGGAGDGSKALIVYINGVQVLSQTIPSGLYRGQANAIALNNHSNQSPFVDFLDLAIYKTNFSQAEVEELYNSGVYKDPNSVQGASLNNHFIFDDNQGDQLPNISNDPVVADQKAGGGLELLASNYHVGELEFATHTFGGGVGGGNLRIHYKSTGSNPNVVNNKHYWTLNTQYDKVSMNVKTKELYVSAISGSVTYSVEADLTNITSSMMYSHTGSGVDD